MKIKISILILALALLVGCSQTEKEIVTESQSQTNIRNNYLIEIIKVKVYNIYINSWEGELWKIKLTSFRR